MTNRTQLELEPGLVLDARRALWLARERVLVVADLHLGYTWTHRHAGQLLPLVPDTTQARLDALVKEFVPEQLVLLGDVIHGFTSNEEALEEIRELVSGIGSRVRLRLVEGNHDFALAKMLRRLGLNLKIELQVSAGPHLLLHGHIPDDLKAAALIAAASERGGRVIAGHEHPAVRLSDGVASSARCPCFVVGNGALVLPCFTEWSVGGSVGESWLSALGKTMKVERRIAIIAGKLLSLPAT